MTLGTRHHRPDPRLLGDPPQLGALDRPLREPRATGSSPPPTPASRSRSRPSTPTRPRSRRSPCRRSSATSKPSSASWTRRRSSSATRPAASFTQVLLDHGFGAAGVAINSAPTEGVQVVPLSQVRSTFPVLKNPANRHRAVGSPSTSGHYAFTNTFTDGGGAGALRALRHPGLGQHPLGQRAGQHHPGHQGTWVDYHNDNRAPLLFISGSEDHIMPPSVQKSNAKHYKSATITEISEFDGCPTCCRRRRAGSRSPTTPWTGRWPTRRNRRRDHQWPPVCGELPAERMTEIVRAHPHRRPDRADRGRRMAAAHRPDVRPPRPALHLRLGHGVAQGRRAGARRRRRRPRSTRCCSPTTTTPTTSTTPGGPCCRRAGVVLTTVAGAERLGGNARRPAPWDDHPTARRPDGRLEVTATPCRHGPPLSRPIVGDVIGFALRGTGSSTARCGSPVTPCSTRRPGGRRPARRGHRRAAPRRRAVRGHRPGPLHDDRRDGVELWALLRPRTSCRCTTRAGPISGSTGPSSRTSSPPRLAQSGTACAGRRSAPRSRSRSDG